MIILLLTALLSVQTPDPKLEAERLARNGAYEEALERFRSLAAADPSDLEARAWIARLHLTMGHLPQAEDVYRSILLQSPNRLDALVGLGSALVSEGQLDEARVVLSRAEELAPNDLEVLAAQGGLNLAAEQNFLAVGYYGRVTLIAPEQNDLRLNFEEARRRFDHRVEATYFNESFSDTTPDTQSGDVTLNLRVNDRLRAFARGQQERRFSTTDARGGGGLEWQVERRRLSSLQVYALAGPQNDVLPRLETGLGLGWTRHTATLDMAGRYFRFENAELWAVGPALRVNVWNDVMVSASYTHTVAQFANFGDSVGGDSGDVHVGFHVHPRVWVDAGYARGIENFERVTVDRLGQFRADTVSGTARLNLHSLTSIAATYEYQRIQAGLKMGRVTVRLMQSF